MKWKIVPVEPTPEMLAATADMDGATRGIQDRRCYKAAIAAAPPYVVTDEDVEAAAASHVVARTAAAQDGNYSLYHGVRAALEAFARRLGGES